MGGWVGNIKKSLGRHRATAAHHHTGNNRGWKARPGTTVGARACGGCNFYKRARFAHDVMLLDGCDIIKTPFLYFFLPCRPRAARRPDVHGNIEPRHAGLVQFAPQPFRLVRGQSCRRGQRQPPSRSRRGTAPAPKRIPRLPAPEHCECWHPGQDAGRLISFLLPHIAHTSIPFDDARTLF